MCPNCKTDLSGMQLCYECCFDTEPKAPKPEVVYYPPESERALEEAWSNQLTPKGENDAG
jgi:hypothetical protein